MQKVSDLFDVIYGNQFDFSKMDVTSMEDPDGINFISRGSTNNGFVAKVKPYEGIVPFPAGLITVTMGGSYLLASFVQPEPFYTAQNIKVLTPKFPMSIETKLFYCAAFQHNRFRYHSHSREANSTFNDILVPAINEIPSWVKPSPLLYFQKEPQQKTLSLQVSLWKPFTFNQLFTIKKGKRLTKADMVEGSIRYIGATDSNNGVTAYIANNEHVHPANTITVSYNGSIAEAFYQDQPFWATDDVNVLYPKFEMNVHIALFLTTLINKEKYRFNYGRKWDKESMEKSIIKLPVIKDNNGDEVPDWKFMEQYMRALPFSSFIS